MHGDTARELFQKHGTQDRPQDGAWAGMDGHAVQPSELDRTWAREEGAGEAELALLAGL